VKESSDVKALRIATNELHNFDHIILNVHTNNMRFSRPAVGVFYILQTYLLPFGEKWVRKMGEIQEENAFHPYEEFKVSTLVLTFCAMLERFRFYELVVWEIFCYALTV